MTSQEETRIRGWNDEQDDDIQIGLLTTEDNRSAELREFCEILTRIAPKVHVVNEEGEPEGLPAIQVGAALIYHSVPLGTELEPFLQSLSPFNEESSRLSASILGQLEKLDLPAALRLYVSQQCPICPAVARQITPLPAVNELISLAVIDCTLFPEIAQSNRVQSVPTVVLDEQFRWTGLLQLEEFVEILINRDPATLSASSLERMLQEGSAIEVAEMMLRKGQLFPPFVDLLVHEKWSVRMGATVAIEEIADRNRELAAQIVDPLWEYFDGVEDPIKDDILYISGKAGDHRMEARLKGILKGQYNAEIKEAARETLEEIEKG